MTQDCTVFHSVTIRMLYASEVRAQRNPKNERNELIFRAPRAGLFLATLHSFPPLLALRPAPPVLAPPSGL